MTDILRTDRLRRGSVSSLGLVTALVPVLYVVFSPTSLRGSFLYISVPVLASLVLIAFGVWLAHSGYRPHQIERITRWAGAGLLIMALVASWEMYLHLLEGTPVTTALHEVTISGSTGAVMGAALGFYHIKRQEEQRHAELIHTAIETSMDGVAILDENEEYVMANEAHADLYGYDDSAAMLGETWRICYDDDELARFEDDVMPVLFAEGEWRGEAVGKRRDGSTFHQELSLTTLANGGLVCVVRDVTERKDREQRLHQSEQRYRQLLETSPGPIFIHSNEGELVYANEAAVEFLGADSRDELIGATAGDFTPPDESGVITQHHHRLVEERESVPPTEEKLVNTNGEVRHAILASAPVTYNGEPAIQTVATDITEHKAHEQRIEALHEATREMIEATDEQQIADCAIETAAEVLDLPVSAIWLRTDDTTRLEPVAATPDAETLFGELPTYSEEEDSLPWRVFETGDHYVADDIPTDSDRYHLTTEIRSEIILPLADYGVLNTGSTTPDAFDRSDIALAQLLTANTEVALERVEHEQDLREQTAQLERQTDEMEFFNSILRHDVLNSMTVIRARAELLTDQLDGEQRQYATTILDWCDDTVGILQRVRRVLDTLTGHSTLDREDRNLSATLRAEVERIQSTYPDVTVETTIPDDVHVLATELLGDIFGNVLSNAVEHNGTEDLHIAITVEEQSKSDDETVTVRVADNGHGVPDEHKEAVFRRDETGHAKSTGSGFGLFFVDTMMSEYGGDVWVEDNDPQGAVFSIELPAGENTKQ